MRRVGAVAASAACGRASRLPPPGSGPRAPVQRARAAGGSPRRPARPRPPAVALLGAGAARRHGAGVDWDCNRHHYCGGACPQALHHAPVRRGERRPPLPHVRAPDARAKVPRLRGGQVRQVAARRPRRRGPLTRQPGRPLPAAAFPPLRLAGAAGRVEKADGGCAVASPPRPRSARLRPRRGPPPPIGAARPTGAYAAVAAGPCGAMSAGAVRRPRAPARGEGHWPACMPQGLPPVLGAWTAHTAGPACRGSGEGRKAAHVEPAGVVAGIAAL